MKSPTCPNFAGRLGLSEKRSTPRGRHVLGTPMMIAFEPAELNQVGLEPEPSSGPVSCHLLLPRISRAITIFMISVDPSICLHIRR